VLSVHTIVSFDFAVSIVPGWHTTIFPPYFVAGAIFSGFAHGAHADASPARDLPACRTSSRSHHIDNMCKIILATGTMVGYAYGMEFFIAWLLAATPYEKLRLREPRLRPLLAGPTGSWCPAT
jgi:molybdopterin-containing oxidoreductase family membrane subunit